MNNALLEIYAPYKNALIAINRIQKILFALNANLNQTAILLIFGGNVGLKFIQTRKEHRSILILKQKCSLMSSAFKSAAEIFRWKIGREKRKTKFLSGLCP